MENEEQNDFRLEGTGFAYTLSLINGKYKMPILYCLSKREVVRYNEMKRYLGKVTFKTLTDSLKALEEDGLSFHNFRSDQVLQLLDSGCHFS